MGNEKKLYLLIDNYLPISCATRVNEGALCSSYVGKLKIGLAQSPLSLAMWRTDCK